MNVPTTTTATAVTSLNINNTGAKNVVPQGRGMGLFTYQGFLYSQDVTFIYNNNTYQPLAGMDYYYYYYYDYYSDGGCDRTRKGGLL